MAADLFVLFFVLTCPEVLAFMVGALIEIVFRIQLLTYEFVYDAAVSRVVSRELGRVFLYDLLLVAVRIEATLS